MLTSEMGLRERPSFRQRHRHLAGQAVTLGRSIGSTTAAGLIRARAGGSFRTRSGSRREIRMSIGTLGIARRMRWTRGGSIRSGQPPFTWGTEMTCTRRLIS